MKKGFVLVMVFAVLFGVFSVANEKTEAKYQTQSYIPPVIGTYSITRLECNGHIGQNGGTFMDISLSGNTDYGMPVYASGDGTTTVSEEVGYGKNVVVTDGTVSFRYAHLSKVYVANNLTVHQGDLIGLIGMTGGNSTGYHLHWDGWYNNGQTFDIVTYFQNAGYISLNQYARRFGQACVDNQNVGTITGNSRFDWDSCPEFYSLGIQDVVLFDHKNCRGNFAVLDGTGSFDLTGNFNDRTRSIYIPPQTTIVVYAHMNDNTYRLCHNVDMWNVDTDHYAGYPDTNPDPSINADNGVRLGYQGDSNTEGFNMISRVVVLENVICEVSDTAIEGAYPGPSPYVNVETWDIGGGIPPTPVPTGVPNTPVPQYGDSHVDIREDTNFSGTQYGWDNPTNGWFNVPDYMNDRTSSIAVDGGYSLRVAKDQNGGGATKCLVTSYTDLSGAYYDNGDPMTDTISSVWVYNDSICGGGYLGTEPGDTVTVWVNANYNHTHYGWHDPFSNNVPDYTSNAITSVGVTPGWSAVMYRSSNLGDGFACFTASDSDLGDNQFNDGYPVNDNVESVEIFHDSNCGGRMHPPTITTLTANVTNPSTGEVTITYNISGAAPGYSIHTDFGDGASFDMLGPSVQTSVTRNYPPGPRTISVTVKGTDAVAYPNNFTLEIPSNATPTPVPTVTPIPQPSFALTIASADTSTGQVQFNAQWNNALNDWQRLEFGHDGIYVDYQGGSGNITDSHIFNPGNFTMTFSVKGLDGLTYTTTQSIVMPEPTLSLTINSVDPVSGLVNYTAAWAYAPVDSWQRLHFGQEDFYVDYQGSSDTKVDSHIYPPGNYTMTLTVNGRDGRVYTATQPISIPFPAPTYSFNILSVDPVSGLVHYDLAWNNALNDWQHMDFGHDGAYVDYQGASGNITDSHIFNPGTYTMTFTVKGQDGQNYPTTQQITVVGPPTATPIPLPTVTLTILSVDNQTGLVQYQAQWNNALDDWQHMDFGHDGAYVDYQGAMGDITDSHTFNPGTYTLTFTVKGLDNNLYPVTQQVTITG